MRLAETSEPPPESAPDGIPVATRIHTEAVPREVRGHEIAEQEPLQALFMTDETMGVDRVIELCGGLPGINSCVLAQGSVIIAAHRVPAGVDLVSMSAHAEDMLRSMRESTARMGVGTVPAVTLHTEKGVISFFHRDDLTMLVFHRDRGFIPGVREKMAAVLGELTKARLTLPVGAGNTGPSH
jgi:predicted regulator of Ras-like GTPase activity (Roadblock/LC7/MglB family)